MCRLIRHPFHVLSALSAYCDSPFTPSFFSALFSLNGLFVTGTTNCRRSAELPRLASHLCSTQPRPVSVGRVPVQQHSSNPRKPGTFPHISKNMLYHIQNHLYQANRPGQRRTRIVRHRPHIFFLPKSYPTNSAPNCG